MSDEDIRDEANKYAKSVYPRNDGRSLRKRHKLARARMQESRSQREALIKATSSTGDREWAGILYGPHVKGRHGSMVDYKSEENMIRGLCKRIGRALDYDLVEIRRFGAFVQDWLEQNLKPLPYIELSHENLDLYWLNGSKYNQREKEKFHRLFQDYLDGNFELKRLNECKIFIKREITMEIKEPRIICSRSDMFKAVVAIHTKAIEDAVYDQHFIKHCHPDEVKERVARVTSNFPYLYETDYSSFESSYSTPFLQEVEGRLFRHMLRNNPQVLRHFEDATSGQNVLVCPWMWVKMPGSRMSGEMWTSLANGFTNMMMIHYMAHTTPEDVPVRYDFIVEGDDGLIGTTSKLNTDIVKKLGFNLTLREGTSINDLSFCGIILGPGKRLFCHPDNVLVKFGRTTDPTILNSRGRPGFEELLRSDLRTRALSMSVYCANNPVLTDVINKSLELTRGAKLRLESLDYWESDILEVQKYWDEDLRRLPSPDSEAFEFAEHAFGVDKRVLDEISDEVNQQSSMCFSIRHRLEDQNGGVATDHYLHPKV